MRPATESLPRSLQQISADVGLEYLTHTDGVSGDYPVACARLPVFANPEAEVANLPLQVNFSREELDMDSQADREEYNRIMTYIHAGYGGRLHHIERRYVKKVSRSDGGKRSKLVERIFIEYFAPYRVLR